MAVLMTPPYLQFFDANGDVLAGGKVYTYTATGTFSTAKATFTTEAGDVEHPNPVILDAAGRPATGNGSIWLSGTYDFVVKDANDVEIESTQNVTAFTALPSTSDAYFESFSGTGIQTAFTTSDDLGVDEKAIYVWVNSGLQESVTNGDFATDSGWTKGAGWTIGSGVATATGAISTAISQTSITSVIEGQAYSVTYTITRSAGGLIPSVGGNNGTEQTASGTYTEVIIAGATQELAFTGNSFTGTLDNVSITQAVSSGYELQNPSSYTIDGTTLTFATAPATGTNNIYVSAPSLLVGAASSAAADAATSAAEASASANEASSAAGLITVTSTTSVEIGTGAKVFTVASGLSLNAGQFILVASDASPQANYMWGSIASYSGTTLTVTVEATSGSGTLADWTMYLTGERGETGATGSISDLSGVPAGTVTTSDKLIFDDVDDSNNTKSTTVGDLLDLSSNTWELLSTQTASASTSIDFESLIDGTYRTYAVIMSNIVPSVGAEGLHLRTSTNNGSSYDATNYEYHTENSSLTSASYSGTTGGAGAAQIVVASSLGSATANNGGYSGVLYMFSPDEAVYTQFRSIGLNATSDQSVKGVRSVAESVDAIRFLPQSGNFTSGTFKLYGIN
jgi:hypothetical protein